MSTHALGFLLARSARNRVVAATTRLRSPRYALGALVGAAYVVLVFGHPAHSHHPRPGLDPSSHWVTLAPLALAALVAWWWIRGGFESALAFAPAEADFLFPAPVRRRTLIAYKLLRAQPGLVFTAAFFFIVFPVTIPLAWPLAFVSIWLIVTALQWHQLAASLVRADLAEHAASARRSALPVTILLVALAALLTGLVSVLPALRAASSIDQMLALVTMALQQPGPKVVLYPFRLLLAPVLAPDTASWLRALPAVLALLALHFVWVIRSDSAFEEAAAEAGRKRAEMRANRRKGLALHRPAMKRVARPWFDLRPTGRPGTALVWKNVVGFTRELRPAFMSVALAAIGIVYALVAAGTHSLRSGADIAAGVLGALLVMTAVMSPIGLRYDLRGDLRHMELLRTYPIRGRELVTGEIVGATVSLALMQAVLLIVALLFAAAGTLGRVHPGLVALAALLGLPIIVTVTAIQCTIQNALALLFPAWVRDTEEMGIQVMGQRLLSMLGSMFLLTLLIVPAIIVGAIAFAAAAALWGTVAAAIAAGVIACATLVGEIAGVMVWLGRVYDRLDPVEAGLLA